MSWNRILILAMGSFIVFVVAMGVKMATSNEALYEEDYYEQGEKHAERMALEGAGEKVSVTLNRDENRIDVLYDSVGYVSGYSFVYLANNALDFDEKSVSDIPQSKESITINRKLEKGIWVLEIFGTVNGVNFFKKQQFVL